MGAIASKRISWQTHGPRRVDGDIANPSASWKSKAWDYPTEISTGPPVGETEQHGLLGDIVGLFHNRYHKLRKVLERETGIKTTGSITEVKHSWSDYPRRTATLIGIVVDVRRTKSSGRMVEIEDTSSDTLTVFVAKEDPAAGTLLWDDVIAVSGTFNKDGSMFWTNRVQYPDILATNVNKGGAEYDPVSIAFISDAHMGSKYFMEKEWDKMMEWLNSDDETAHNIKYLVIAGDAVDGIGVYPGQEKNLAIMDVYDQYEFFARKLDMLPDHITPILSPGNHDAVRPAEPQPMLEPLIRQRFNSAIHTGNPGRINLSGIDVLTYHGKGIDDMVPRMAHVTYEAPAEAMKEMLRKRHLAPMWGERNALSPEEEDQMVIEAVPDLFVTGHTHAHQMEWWRGVPLVVSSTFQRETDFMQMLGYKPKKGYLSVYNIQNREMRVVAFDED